MLLNFLTAIFNFFTRAYDAWRDSKLRNEGRQEAAQEAQAKEEHNEAVASAARTDAAIIDIVRARFDRSRAKPPGDTPT